MDIKKMTIPQLKEFLDEHEIDYSEAKLREDYIILAESVQLDQESNEELEEQEENKITNLLDKVQAAKKVEIERTVIQKSNDTSYLTGRDYSQLTAGERLIIREKSPEYESLNTGVKVQVTDRLITNWRIVKLHDQSYSKLLKGEIYTLSQEDYEVLKDEKVKVKTEATKNKCCGQAVYEQIPLLEVLND